MAQPVRKIIRNLHSDLIKKERYNTLLVDGNSLMFNSFKDDKINCNGVHYGGVFQFLLQLRLQLEKRDFRHVFVTFDNQYSGILRYNLYKSYKANRDKDYGSYGQSEYMKALNANLSGMQKALFQRTKKKEIKTSWDKLIDENFDRERDILLEMFNELFIRWDMDEVVEGDDLIAYYCKRKDPNENILIITADMDLCQLLDDDIMIYNQSMKKYITNKNFKSYFGFPHDNVLVKKVMCGDVSDNIGNIKGLSEKKFFEIMPEAKTRHVTVNEIKNRCKTLTEERAKEKKKPLQVHENILKGVSNKEYEGDFYDINTKIIDLKNPILTAECKEEMDSMIHAPLDPTDRSFQNLYRLILEYGIEELMGDTKFASFFRPFKRLEENEKKFYKDNQ